MIFVYILSVCVCGSAQQRSLQNSNLQGCVPMSIISSYNWSLYLTIVNQSVCDLLLLISTQQWVEGEFFPLNSFSSLISELRAFSCRSASFRQSSSIQPLPKWSRCKAVSRHLHLSWVLHRTSQPCIRTLRPVSQCGSPKWPGTR